jgi:hypothetical protein
MTKPHQAPHGLHVRDVVEQRVGDHTPHSLAPPLPRRPLLHCSRHQYNTHEDRDRETERGTGMKAAPVGSEKKRSLSLYSSVASSRAWSAVRSVPLRQSRQTTNHEYNERERERERQTEGGA